MNREFTSREKILMLVLVILLMAVGYGKFYYAPLAARTANAKAQLAETTDNIMIENVRYQRMQEMQAELEQQKETQQGTDIIIPVFNNIESVMVQLDAILSQSDEYSLSFSPVSSISAEDNLVLRPIQMTFQAKNYSVAKKILSYLDLCPYRCSISDVSLSAENDVYQNSPVSANLTVTFYERLPDSMDSTFPAKQTDS